MGVVEEFATQMQNAGVAVDPGQLPDEATLEQAIEYAKGWYDGLDARFKEGLDAVTSQFDGSTLLNDPTLNVAPAIHGLMQAFDQATGWSFGQAIYLAAQCMEAAKQTAGESEGAETESTEGQYEGGGESEGAEEENEEEGRI